MNTKSMKLVPQVRHSTLERAVYDLETGGWSRMTDVNVFNGSCNAVTYMHSLSLCIRSTA